MLTNSSRIPKRFVAALPMIVALVAVNMATGSAEVRMHVDGGTR